MKSKFQIGVNTMPEILSNPPPQFRHVNVLFAPFCVCLTERSFPAEIWTDFGGVFLYRWTQSVWNMTRNDARSARLPFWYRYEIWLRQTASEFWKVTLVEREPEESKQTYDVLVIPEMVESALLSATRKLLAGAKHVNRWPDDCRALQAALDGGDAYWEAIQSGNIEAPSFLYGHIPTAQSTPYRQSPFPESVQDRLVQKPFFCPRCEAKLGGWLPGQMEQNCPNCSERIRLR